MSGSASVRVHTGEYKTPRWGGTLSAFAALADAALAEMLPRKREGQRVLERVHITYDDGTEDFPTIAAFVAAAPELQAEKIRSISVSASLYGGEIESPYSFNLAGSVLSMLGGLTFTADSTDRLWAHGLADVIREQAAPGELPPYKKKRRPLKWWEILIALTAFALAIGYIVWASVDSEDDPPGSVALVLLAIFTLAAMPLTNAVDRRIGNPGLLLRREDQPQEAEDEPKLGAAVRVQGWIRRRPLLSLFLTALFTLACNELSERI